MSLIPVRSLQYDVDQFKDDGSGNLQIKPDPGVTQQMIVLNTDGSLGAQNIPAGGTDTNITAGTLATATTARSADFGGNSLSLHNASDLAMMSGFSSIADLKNAINTNTYLNPSGGVAFESGSLWIGAASDIRFNGSTFHAAVTNGNWSLNSTALTVRHANRVIVSNNTGLAPGLLRIGTSTKGIDIAAPAASPAFTIELPDDLPASGTEMMTINSTGKISRQAIPSGGTDTNITTGTLAAATAARVADFGGNNLSLSNIASYTQNVTGVATLTSIGNTQINAPQLRLFPNTPGTAPSLVLGSGNGNSTTLKAHNSVSSSYTLTTPNQSPAVANSVMVFDTSGNGSFVPLVVDPNHRGVYTDLATLQAAATGGTGDFQAAPNGKGPSVGGNYAFLMNGAGVPATLAAYDTDTSTWVETGGADSNITFGTLPTAVAARTVNMGNNNLLFQNVADYSVQATTFGYATTAGVARFQINSTGQVTLGAYAGAAQDAVPSKYLGVDVSGKMVTFDAPTVATGTGNVKQLTGILSAGDITAQAISGLAGVPAVGTSLVLTVISTDWHHAELTAASAANRAAGKVGWAGTGLVGRVQANDRWLVQWVD